MSIALNPATKNIVPPTNLLYLQLSSIFLRELESYQSLHYRLVGGTVLLERALHAEIVGDEELVSELLREADDCFADLVRSAERVQTAIARERVVASSQPATSPIHARETILRALDLPALYSELLTRRSFPAFDQAFDRVSAAIREGGYDKAQQARSERAGRILGLSRELATAVHELPELAKSTSLSVAIRRTNVEFSVPGLLLALVEYFTESQYLTLIAKRGTEAYFASQGSPEH
jgi:hypothetical protein